MDGQVSWLGTVHPLLTLSFFSTWILPLHVVSCCVSTLKRKSLSSVMDGFQRREEEVCVSREEVHQALNEMNAAPGPSEVSLELIAASG